MIDFRDDGRIRVEFDGNPITLRPPKIREFKALLEYADELDAEMEGFQDIRDQLRAGETTDREELSEFMELRRSIAARFVKKAVDMLGDGKPPDTVDDYPAFTQDVGLPVKMQTHWQTAPLGSSSPSTPVP